MYQKPTERSSHHLTERDVVDEKDAENLLLSCDPSNLEEIIKENADKLPPNNLKTVFHIGGEGPETIFCVFAIDSLQGPPRNWTDLRFSPQFIKAMELVFAGAGVLDKRLLVDWFNAEEASE